VFQDAALGFPEFHLLRPGLGDHFTEPVQRQFKVLDHGTVWHLLVKGDLVADGRYYKRTGWFLEGVAEDDAHLRPPRIGQAKYNPAATTVAMNHSIVKRD
jgi:hypothetical protein